MGDLTCSTRYGNPLMENDGETFGAWITSNGRWGYTPTGCTKDECTAAAGDRDHSQAQRINSLSAAVCRVPGMQQLYRVTGP